MSWGAIQILGVFKMPNDNEYILPLKRFRSKADTDFKSLFENIQ